MSPRALLFDLDGTLANSEPLKGRALAATCAELGRPVDYRHYATVMGSDWPTVTGHFLQRAGLNVPLDDFNPRFRRHYQQLLHDEVSATAGATPLLHAARRAGLRLAVVSSAASWMVEAVLLRCGLENVFDLVISKEDVSQHKPHPAAYLLAMARLGCTPDDALVFEDSRSGLEAATAAGCRCVAVRHELNHRHDFSDACAEISDFRDAWGLLGLAAHSA